MPFDPNKPFDVVVDKSKFDPTKPFEEVMEPSEFESGLRGAAQGVSMGFSDEVTGLIESIFTEKTYQEARDEARAANQLAEDVNPSSFMAGDVAGSIASAFIPGLGAVGNIGRVAKASSTLAKIAKNSPNLGRIGKGFVAGATTGALEGAGRSKADLVEGEVGKFATDVGIGAAAGGVVGGALPAIVQVPNAIKSGGKRLNDSYLAWRNDLTKTPHYAGMLKSVGKNVTDAQVGVDFAKHKFNKIVNELNDTTKSSSALTGNLAPSAENTKRFTTLSNELIDAQRALTSATSSFNRLSISEAETLFRHSLPETLNLKDLGNTADIITMGLGGVFGGLSGAAGAKIIGHDATKALLKFGQTVMKKFVQGPLWKKSVKVFSEKTGIDSKTAAKYLEKQLSAQITIRTGASILEEQN